MKDDTEDLGIKDAEPPRRVRPPIELDATYDYTLARTALVHRVAALRDLAKKNLAGAGEPGVLRDARRRGAQPRRAMTEHREDPRRREVEAALDDMFGVGNVGFVDSGRCIYCGCTEEDACVIPLPEPLALRDGTEVAAVPCEWISHDPPICSAPLCVSLARTDEVLARVSRLGA